MKGKLEALLLELERAYFKSDVQHNQFCKDNNRKWGYELIQTAMVENQPLIIGFNWGVDNSWKEYKEGRAYLNQKEIVAMDFTKIYMGSIKRAMTMCNNYFPQIQFNNGSHSNFCFFRSEKENQISETDIELCIPIFKSMIEILNPSIVLCFSKQAREAMLAHNLVENVKVEHFTSNKGKRKQSCTSGKGTLNNGATIYYFPHPNYPLQKDLRHRTWEYVLE